MEINKNSNLFNNNNIIKHCHKILRYHNKLTPKIVKAFGNNGINEFRFILKPSNKISYFLAITKNGIFQLDQKYIFFINLFVNIVIYIRHTSTNLNLLYYYYSRQLNVLTDKL